MPQLTLKPLAALAMMIVATASAFVVQQDLFLPQDVTEMLLSTSIGDDFNLIRSYGLHIAAVGAAVTVLGQSVIPRLLGLVGLAVGGLTVAAMVIAMGSDGVRLLPQEVLIYVGAYCCALVFLLWYGRTRLVAG